MPSEKAATALEAHVAFELSRWQDDALQEGIRAEVAAFVDWSHQLTLHKVTDAERIQRVATERVLQGDLPDELVTAIRAIADHLIGLPINRETRLGDVIDDEIFDAGVELAIDLRHIRQEIIRQSVESPLYSMLVGEILYNGIKAYLAASSKLLGKGASMLSKGLSALDNQVEKRLRAWIESNSGPLAKQSRKFLDHALTDERIREVAEEVWNDLRESPMSIRDALQDDDLDAISEFLKQAWLQLRETDYVQELVHEGIGEFFRLHGDTPVHDLLHMVSITPEVLEREAIAFAPDLVAAAQESGALEAMLRRRLAPFYESEAAAALFG